MKTEIITTLSIEGVHRWLGANHQEYKYLKSYHRHMFEIEATKVVTDLDREIEIIQLSHQIRHHLLGYFDRVLGLCDFGEKSCEHLAHELMAAFGLESCSVREDGQMGARVQLNQYENWVLVGRSGSGKSTLANNWYRDWNIIEVGEIARRIAEVHNRRFHRPEIANEIAYAIKMRLKDAERNLIVGIRQPQIIEKIEPMITNVVGLTSKYTEHDPEEAAIDDKLGISDIKINVILPWTYDREDDNG